VSSTAAQPTALVIDLDAGTGSRGTLFSVDLITGDRTIISDFGNAAQGPLGLTPIGVVFDPSGDALVIDQDAGTGSMGALFSVDLFTGFRTIISDFGNAGQGPLGTIPRSIILDGSGNALIVDRGTTGAGDGFLFSVDLTTGFRTIISDFGNAAQGSLGIDPVDVTLEDSSNALVIDRGNSGSGTNGILFRVNIFTGFRTIISDFGNAGQGPLGVNPFGVILDGFGDALVSDIDAGTGMLGELFSVDLTTGNRGTISNFGNTIQGPLGVAPLGLTLFALPIIPETDLAVVKEGFPDPVVVGETLTYTVFVINYGPGPDDATGVILTDTLPAGVTFVSAPGCVEAGGVVTCDIGDMAVGDIEQVDITVTAPGSAGAILNIAQVTFDQEDPLPANNMFEEITQVVDDPISPQTSELLLIKTDSPDPVVVDTPLTYTLFVSNQGPDDATGVVITDTLPAGVTFDSATGCSEAAGVVTCTVGALANGAAAVFEITVTPNSTGIIFNVATVQGDQGDPTPGNNIVGEVTTVVDEPVIPLMSDLSVVKADFPDPVIVGETLVYTLFVVNYGPDDATGVMMTDTLPAGVIFGTAVSSQGLCVNVLGVVTCDIGAMAVGDIVEINITVTAPGSVGTILNIAEVSSDQEDPIPADNRAEEITQVVDAPITPEESNLFILKSDTPDPVVVGDQLTYLLFIANLGPDDATGVVITDTLPAGVNF